MKLFISHIGEPESFPEVKSVNLRDILTPEEYDLWMTSDEIVSVSTYRKLLTIQKKILSYTNKQEE